MMKFRQGFICGISVNILPSDFFNRITDIFLYQMDKKYNNDIRWKYCRGMIMELL